MAKAVISNRIYLDNPGTERTELIKKALTYKLPKFSSNPKMGSFEVIKSYKVLPAGIVSIPAGREDLIPEDYEVIDKRVSYQVPFPTPLFPLREDQLDVINLVSGNAFINALPGWGKTFTALHLAAKLGERTLVITHTTNLRDQWIDEVKVLFGIDCGVIGSGKFDIDGHAIVVTNIQSLVKHVTSIQKEFGLLIVDECHHVPSTTFNNVVDAVYCKHRVGLSGTMIRKDGKHILFKDYFGFNVIQPTVANTIAPIVKIIDTGITLDPKLGWTDKITQLTQDEQYRHFIANIAKAQISRGHSVLIVADRVDFLEGVKNYVGDTCLLVTGNTSKEGRDAAKEQLMAKEKLCVAGSRQIFSEGISINVLSCVILAVPISNDSLLEQIAGRIMRIHPNKPDPLIIDLNFSGYADRKQNNARLSLYIQKGWKVTRV